MKTALTFRQAGPEDAGIVHDLIHAAYAKWVPVIGHLPRPMTFYYAQSVRDHFVELALRDGKAIAVLDLILEPDCLVLENIAVDPAAQGGGIGGALMERVEQHARRRGLGLVRLYTNRKFATNIAFYERRGYAVEREEQLADRVLVHMAKTLPP